MLTDILRSLGHLPPSVGGETVRVGLLTFLSWGTHGVSILDSQC
jgi:hypothetical protein